MLPKDEVKSYERLFEIYAILPKIFAGINVAVGIILAHVLGIIFKSFGIWFACIAGGAALAAAAWFFTGIIVAPTILKVVYLYQIKNENKKSEKKDNDFISKLPNI